jgi:hypothetical protein
MKKIYIGIDGGRDTGLAAWDSSRREFIEILTTTFWGSIHKIVNYNNYCKQNGYELTVIIENPSGNSPVFKAEKVYKETKGSHRSKISASAFVAQSVGSVKRESELIIEFCVERSIDHRAVTPGKNSMTKLTAEVFGTYTGYKKRTSQHGRDAAMLIFQR